MFPRISSWGKEKAECRGELVFWKEISDSDMSDLCAGQDGRQDDAGALVGSLCSFPVRSLNLSSLLLL